MQAPNVTNSSATRITNWRGLRASSGDAGSRSRRRFRRGRAKVIAAGSEEVAMTDADVARRAAQAKWWCAE